MKNWTIRGRIVVSFAVILALMGAMATFSYTRLSRIDHFTTDVNTDSLAGLDYLHHIAVAVVTSDSLTREGLVASGAAAERLLKEIQSVRASLSTLAGQYEGTINTPADRELFENLKQGLAASAAVQDDILTPTRARTDDSVKTSLARLAQTFEQTRGAVTAIADYNQAEALKSTRLIDETVTSAKRGVLVTLLVAFALAVACGYLLFRAIARPLGRLVTRLDVMRTGDLSGRLLAEDGEFGAVATGFNRMTDELAGLVGRVQESGLHVSTSVTEIAATAREQQATASEIAATTNEIGATSREISDTSKTLVETMNEVATVAEHSAVLAGQGRTGLTHMEKTMTEVMEAAASINAKLAVLSEKAGKISQVVTTITRVADQTNLLSLNAAIEAEKAGDYGRGFAVVATEVRRLADQTAIATFDIEQMVKEIQSAVAAGVMGMDKFSEQVRRGMEDVRQVGGQLSQVIQQVQALAPRVESVNEGMLAQANGAEQITYALAQLSEAALQTVDSLRQSSVAIDELNRVATGLRSGISRFTVNAA